MQTSASILPRTSLSKFGGKFNSLFMRLLTQVISSLRVRATVAERAQAKEKEAVARLQTELEATRAATRLLDARAAAEQRARAAAEGERDEWSASRTEFPSGFMSGRSTPPKNASKTSTLPKIATPLALLPHVAHFSVKISQPKRARSERVRRTLVPGCEVTILSCWSW